MVIRSLHSIFASICLVIYLLIVHLFIGFLVWILCFENLNLVIHWLLAFLISQDSGQRDAICSLTAGAGGCLISYLQSVLSRAILICFSSFFLCSHLGSHISCGLEQSTHFFALHFLSSFIK